MWLQSLQQICGGTHKLDINDQPMTFWAMFLPCCNEIDIYNPDNTTDRSGYFMHLSWISCSHWWIIGTLMYMSWWIYSSQRERSGSTTRRRSTIIVLVKIDKQHEMSETFMIDHSKHCNTRILKHAAHTSFFFCLSSAFPVADHGRLLINGGDHEGHGRNIAGKKKINCSIIGWPTHYKLYRSYIGWGQQHVASWCTGLFFALYIWESNPAIMEQCMEDSDKIKQAVYHSVIQSATATHLITTSDQAM